MRPSDKPMAETQEPVDAYGPEDGNQHEYFPILPESESQHGQTKDLAGPCE